MRAALILALLVAMTGCGHDSPPPVRCEDLIQGCRLADARALVRTDHTPSALRPFLLTVDVPSAGQVTAEFIMQGMEMGANRYRLEKTAVGIWRARVTLPVCVSGRRDWLLILDIDGERHALAFVAG